MKAEHFSRDGIENPLGPIRTSEARFRGIMLLAASLAISVAVTINAARSGGNAAADTGVEPQRPGLTHLDVSPVDAIEELVNLLNCGVSHDPSIPHFDPESPEFRSAESISVTVPGSPSDLNIRLVPIDVPSQDDECSFTATEPYYTSPAGNRLVEDIPGGLLGRVVVPHVFPDYLGEGHPESRSSIVVLYEYPNSNLGSGYTPDPRGGEFDIISINPNEVTLHTIGQEMPVVQR